MNNNHTGILLVMIMMLYKPTTLGAITTPIAMILSVLMLFLFSNRNGKKLPISNHVMKMIASVVLYYSYCFFNCWVQTGLVKNTAFKAMISICMIIACYSILLSEIDTYKAFCKAFILFLVFQVCSYLITFALSIGRSNVYSLEAFSLYIEKYGYNLNMYYPFTFATGRWIIFSKQILRLSAMFRECGIAQLFYIWAYSECKYFFERSQLIKIILFLGILFCLSTAGYVCLIAFLVLELLLTRKEYSKKQIGIRISMVLVVMGLIIMVFTFPGIRIADKNAVSIKSRLGYYEIVFDLLKKNLLFGIGANTITGTATTFLQTLYGIGIVGFWLYISIFINAYNSAIDKKRFVLANLASIITLMFSQPIYDAPIVFLLAVLPYGYGFEDMEKMACLSEQ